MPPDLPARAFFACYLVVSLDRTRAGKSYVGFTVDPARRLARHNGAASGGAKYTCTLRPCDMVLIISGFANKIQALQFEWAWQHPASSKATKAMALAHGMTNATSAPAKKTRLACLMLSVAPWKRMALRVDCLTQSTKSIVDSCVREGVLPKHVDVHLSAMADIKALARTRAAESDDDESHAYGEDVLNVAGDGDAISMSERSETSVRDGGKALTCAGCGRDVTRARASAGCGSCGARAHVTCLAKHFFATAGAIAKTWDSRLIPERGPCLSCEKDMEWAEVVSLAKRRRGGEGSSAPKVEARLRSVDEELDVDVVSSGRKRAKSGKKVIVGESAEKERARVRAWREETFDDDEDEDEELTLRML